MKLKKKIVFLTGTRADYGKLKSLIVSIKDNKNFEPIIIVTGMHLQKLYGSTYTEIQNDFADVKIIKFNNQKSEDSMDLILSNTIKKLSKILKNINPDLVLIHGDRVETLAASICCNLNNILIAHIEGGEVSGTVDESIRHATTKLSHIHLVSNMRAKNILVRMGEIKSNIYITGSPEVDIMIKSNLPSIEDVKSRYDIKFKNYAIFLFHPVTTLNKKIINTQLKSLFKAIKESSLNYVVIYPNNDTHSKIIFKYINKLKKNKNFKILPSLRFEYYLSLLKNSDFIIGNSSSGIREAAVYGVYSINLGDRQLNRIKSKLVNNLDFNERKILKAIKKIRKKKSTKAFNFGKGQSAKKFKKIISKKNFWKTSVKKNFS